MWNLLTIIFSFILSLSPIEVFSSGVESTFEEGQDLILKGKKKKEFEWNLALVAVFRDEAEWLKEWIEFHKTVGVEHFYLYNNLSSDNFEAILQPYMDAGEVELFNWAFDYPEGKEGPWIKVQTDAINDAIDRAKTQAKWLAIIDIDEFLVPVKYNTITDLLRSYDNVIPKLSQVMIKWVMFGTSNVYEVPRDKLMIEMLTNNGGKKKDALYKSIVKPKDVTGCGNTHYCGLAEKRREEHVSFEHAQINHYWTRDERYLIEAKLPRREKIGYPADVVLDWAESYNLDNPVTAMPIQRFIETIRQKMRFE